MRYIYKHSDDLLVNINLPIIYAYECTSHVLLKFRQYVSLATVT